MKLNELREKIKQHSSREARTNGNPNKSDIDRELSRAGKKRKPDDIPTQDTKTRRGKHKAGNFKKGTFVSSTVETKGRYKIGPAIRPHIVHDAGFSRFPKRPPKFADYLELYKWLSMLEAAEALRPGLSDGIAAYRHYHEGEGKPRIFSYERYLMNDESGRVTLRNAILDAQDAAITLWHDHRMPNKFIFTGPPIPCGTYSPKFPNVGANFPYPSTENWQKAIGAHVIWLSGNVTVKTISNISLPPEFTMTMVIHAEDQYNFNPGETDIATGLPDDANGMFVVVGFAHGYYQSSTVRRKFSWKSFDLGVSSMGTNIIRRQGQPRNNMRPRNRI